MIKNTIYLSILKLNCFVINQHLNTCSIICNRPNDRWITCRTEPPLRHLQSHGTYTILNIGDGKVMLIGGLLGKPTDVNEQILSRQVFEGTLSNDMKDVTWKHLDNLKKPRKYHFTFKLGNNVYVAGGLGKNDKPRLCCERFDLETKRWFKSPHWLPYPLWLTAVDVDVNETFAAIVGGLSIRLHNQKYVSDSVIIFSERQGFVTLKQSLNTQRSESVALRIQ